MLNILSYPWYFPMVLFTIWSLVLLPGLSPVSFSASSLSSFCFFLLFIFFESTLLSWLIRLMIRTFLFFVSGTNTTLPQSLGYSTCLQVSSGHAFPLLQMPSIILLEYCHNPVIFHYFKKLFYCLSFFTLKRRWLQAL